MIWAKNSFIILLLFLSACTVNYYNRPKEVTEESIQSKPVPKSHKFDLTEQERELNKDNEFLQYLETGKGGYEAVKRKQKKQGTVSRKQRKAVTR